MSSYIEYYKPLVYTHYLIVKEKMIGLYNIIMNNKGMSIFLVCTILSIISKHPIKTAIIGSLLYLMTLFREMVNHKKSCDQMQLIDINFFNNQREFDGPLDSFIDMCFNEVLVLSRGWKEGQYITKKEEDQIMRDLIDMMARSMGPIMKKKLELYYGPEQVDSALARKCFIKVSLYVANNNKILYVDTQKKSKNSSSHLDDMLRDAMMITGMNGKGL